MFTVSFAPLQYFLIVDYRKSKAKPNQYKHKSVIYCPQQSHIILHCVHISGLQTNDKNNEKQITAVKYIPVNYCDNQS